MTTERTKTDILIIGNGYVSQHLQKSLTALGIGFVVVTRAAYDYTYGPTVRWLILEFEPKIVINCSGYTGKANVDSAENEKELCQVLNTTTPVQMALICNMMNVKYYHISTGCIYTGYEKEWTEEDKPNFGVFNEESSWYSKTKHCAELALELVPHVCVRIRMPFGKDMSNRNLVNKLLKYDYLVNFLNTKTYISDLGDFLVQLIDDTKDQKLDKPLIYNYGCIDPLTTKQFTQIMKENHLWNPLWSWIELEDLNMKANRSNCVLSMDKAIKAGYKVRSEEECLREALAPYS